jgi:hypothetical protein
MDYRKAWDEVKSKLEESIQEGLDNGYDKGSGTSFENGAYHAYKRVYDDMVKLESETVSKEIRVGDTVRVVNPGLCYSSYSGWIKENVENPLLAVRWAANRSLRKGETGLVRYLAPHSPGVKAMIAYIDVGNACFMIEINGLEKIGEG